MREFGNSQVFSIKYEFTNNPYDEIGIIGNSWGVFELWVNGKELCRFLRNNQECNYEWNLIYLVDWISKNLNNILYDEEFPLPVNGKTTLELLINSSEFNSDNDDEFDEWFSAKQDWEFKHSWISSRGGSYLPGIYFRRSGEQIEISWDNEGIYNDEVSFPYMTGVEYVPIEVFEAVVKEFIGDFLNYEAQYNR
ncbi:hypothetical protein [Paenibacillus senegalimassiliensis]|uniref:hypothetical protein n=1 Tax=Paenibacillus senegalimassiliensis TaxID=1737426 RepID=UPI00073F5B9E|nr:hypothetical protein [Paenibacillus senegalimassiliensis]